MVPVIPLARSEAMKAATLAISVSVETSFPVASGGDQLAELFPRDAPRVRGAREDLLDRVAFRHTGGSQAKDANAARSELCPDRLRVSCSTAAIAGPTPPIKAMPSRRRRRDGHDDPGALRDHPPRGKPRCQKIRSRVRINWP